MNPPASIHAPSDPLLSNDDSKSRQVRAVGRLLIVMGPCISAGMAYAAFTLHGTILSDRLAGRQAHWHGSPEFTRTVSELYGTVFLLGIAILLGGIYQVRTGRRSPVLVILALGLAAVAAYLVFGIATSRQSAL